MTEKVFDCLVLGAEPQGLWLLTQLHKRYAQCRADHHLGWLELGVPSSQVPFSTTMAPIFDIAVAQSCRFEMISRKKCTEWTGFEVTPKGILPSKAEKKALAFALKKNPQLLTQAGAIWRQMGRTPTLMPESLLWNASLCASLFWWDPKTALPKAVKRVGVADPSGIRITRLAKNPELKVTLASGDSYTTKHLVLATHPEEFDALSEGIRKTVPHFEEAPVVDYRFTLTLKDNPHLKVCADLVTFVESDEIADIETEMWPFRVEQTTPQQIEVWVRLPRDASVEKLQAQLRLALSHLSQQVPGLTDFKQSHGKAAAQRLYLTSGWRTDCLLSGMHFLGPHLNCFLPYPLGPLLCAQQLYQKLLDRRRIRRAEKMLASPV